MSIAGRSGRVFALAIAFVLSTAGGVLAHVVYAKGHTWEDAAGHCVKGYAQTSHGATGDGYFETDADLYKMDILRVHCGAADWFQTVGNISVRSEAFVANGASGAPVSLCKDYGFKYNAIQGSHLGQSRNITNTVTDLCNLNYYGEYGGAFVNYNGAWRGGYLWSGCHWLPTYKPASAC